MDIQAVLICIVLVILSGAILLFISMFDMHKKTYEEAIAEQRKMPENSLLLGRRNKDHKSGKKQKKTANKKEKKNNSGSGKETSKIQMTKNGKLLGKSSSEVASKAAAKVAAKATAKAAAASEKKIVETPKKDKSGISSKVNEKRSEKNNMGVNKKGVKEELKPPSKSVEKNLNKTSSVKSVEESRKTTVKLEKVNSAPLIKGKDKTNESSANKKLKSEAVQLPKKHIEKDDGNTKKGVQEKKNVENQVKVGKVAEKAAGDSVSKAKKNNVHKQNTHVNFIQPDAKQQNAPQPSSTGDNNQKKGKKKNTSDPVKPILLNKNESIPKKSKLVEQPKQPVNNFTKTIPKDELKLKLSQKDGKMNPQSNTENIKPNQTLGQKKNESKLKSDDKENKKSGEKNDIKTAMKPLGNSNKKNIQEGSAKTNKIEKTKSEQSPRVEAKEFVSLSLPVKQQPTQQKKALKQQTNNKEHKMKKIKNNELHTIQQITEKDRINSQLLIPLIKKAELSRLEVQDLTDILLTKHTDNEFAGHSEWIEGRQDPVVKLKKQLAEKEKALAEEQEASQAFQNRVKELRAEINAERARLNEACRQYEKTIVTEHNKIQDLHARNRHLLDSHVSEKQALTQKLQQLQAQIADETLMIRKLQEENSQTHNALQQELVNQRTQMEMHMARVNEQHQETENTLKAQIHAHLQEMEQLTASFNAEIQKNRRNEEEIRELREQHIQSQAKIKTLESRASQLKESSNHSQELSRQIEELQRINDELEKRLNGSIKIEEELNFDKMRLQNEVHNFTNKISDLETELDRVMKEKEKLASQIMSKIEIEKELLRLKEENQSLLSQVASISKIEREAQQLREENENLAAQMTAFTERPAADGRENGDTSYNEDQKKNINIDFINHENEVRNNDMLRNKYEEELHQKKLLISSLNSELSGCKSEISRLSSELNICKTEIPRLHEELEAQKNKNNDLRRKNGKAMEALASTEKSLENKLKETEKLLTERLSSMQVEQQKMSKEVLQRIFPDISIDEKVYEKWWQKFEESAKNYLRELSRAGNDNSGSVELVNELETKNVQLQSLVTHYKNIIDDTEGMLNKLQSHIEQEEIRWNCEIEKKELEINTLKKDYDALNERNILQMQPKIIELEKKINQLTVQLESSKQKVVQLEEEVMISRENSKKISEKEIKEEETGVIKVKRNLQKLDPIYKKNQYLGRNWSKVIPI